MTPQHTQSGLCWGIPKMPLVPQAKIFHTPGTTPGQLAWQQHFRFVCTITQILLPKKCGNGTKCVTEDRDRTGAAPALAAVGMEGIPE